jgi:hypothetical protein
MKLRMLDTAVKFQLRELHLQEIEEYLRLRSALMEGLPGKLPKLRILSRSTRGYYGQLGMYHQIKKIIKL